MQFWPRDDTLIVLTSSVKNSRFPSGVHSIIRRVADAHARTPAFFVAGAGQRGRERILSSLLHTIEEKMGQFSKGQKKIARYICENYDKAAFMTASKLGREVGVSESTVVRFAMEVGFEGYPQFQRSLKELIKRNLSAVQRMRVTSEQIGDRDVLSRVLELDIATVRKTEQAVSSEDFNRAVETLLEARRIYIVGMRGASSLSSFTAYYFNMIFENVHLVSEDKGSDVFEQIVRIGEGDVILGISFPRYSKKTVRALTCAAKSGAKVISITDSEKSPIAAMADTVLYAKSEMISFVDSLVAPLSLINALIVALGQRKQTEVFATLGKLETMWNEDQVYENIGEV